MRDAVLRNFGSGKVFGDIKWIDPKQRQEKERKGGLKVLT